MNTLTLFCGIAVMFVTSSCATKSAENTENTATDKTEAAAPKEVVVAPVASDGKVIELSDKSLIPPGVKVTQLTVIDFNATWCGPCRALAPVLEEMAAKYKGKVTFISVDVDRFGDLFEAYNLGGSIPAVVFIRPDGQTKSYIGIGELLPATSFEAIIEANIQ